MLLDVDVGWSVGRTVLCAQHSTFEAPEPNLQAGSTDTLGEESAAKAKARGILRTHFAVETLGCGGTSFSKGNESHLQ